MFLEIWKLLWDALQIPLLILLVLIVIGAYIGIIALIGVVIIAARSALKKRKEPPVEEPKQ